MAKYDISEGDFSHEKTNRVGVCSLSLSLATMPAAAATEYLTSTAPVTTPDPLVDLGKAPGYATTLASADIRVFLHTISLDDGSGGLGATVVDSMVAVASQHMEQLGVYLVVSGRDTIPNSSYYAAPDTFASALFLENPHTDAIDVYLGPAIGDARGRAEGIPGSALVLTGALESHAALSHLLGHCLGLYDTDETAFGVELPDGSNSGTTGDLITDTNADPGLVGNVLPDCSIDPVFAAQYAGYSPDVSNIMSNAPIGCWTHFTEEQRDRVLAAIESLAVLQDAMVWTPSASGYIDRTAESELALIEGYPPFASGAAGFDFDNDGEKDLIVVGHAEQASDQQDNLGIAARWDHWGATSGVPVFQEDQDALAGGPPAAGAKGVLLADYDNDGDLDFYIPRPEYHDYDGDHDLYRNNGDGTFSDVTSTVFPSGDATLGTVAAAWGDYDGDGFVDLLVCARNSSVNPVGSPYGSESIRLYRNVQATGTDPTARRFEDVTTNVGLTSTYEEILSPLWVDLDQDHDMDLVLIRYTELPSGTVHSGYFRNVGGAFVDVTATDFSGCAVFTTDPRPINTLAAAGDIDNDGYVDIVCVAQKARGYLKNVCDETSGNSSLLCGYWESVDDEVSGRFSEPTGISAFDYGLNGTIDLAYSNKYSTNNRHRVIENTGASGDLFEEHVLRPGTGGDQPARGLGATDWNLDGLVELLVCNLLPATPTAYAERAFFQYEEATSNHWIGIRLDAHPEGSTDGELLCNSRGIGATVIVHAGDHVQAQVVDGGSGNASQHDLDLSFGLGSYADSVEVEVIWPCGQSQCLRIPGEQCDRYHTITLLDYTMVAGSTRAYLDWSPGDTEQAWVFEWTTKGHFCGGESWIEFPDSVYPTLTESSPDVEYTKVAIDDTDDFHGMSWTGRPCNQQALIQYVIHSEANGQEVTSGGKLRVFNCPVAQ